MKYKISLLSIAMATIVLVSMVAAAGVSTAQAVGSTSTANVAAAHGDGLTVLAVQGSPNPQTHSPDTIYAAVGGVITGSTTGLTWAPIGVGTNPTVVYTGVGTTPGPAPDFAIFWNDNGVLMEVTTTAAANGAGASIWAAQTGAGMLPTTPSLASGMGPTAVYTATATPNTGETEIFYVATGGALMEWSQSGSTAWPTTLGGNVLASPAASTTSTGAGICVVVKGTNAIYERQYALGGWGGYEKFHDGAIGLGASLVRTPTEITSSTAGSMYLVVAGTQGRMWVLYSANDGSTWSTQGAPSGTQNLNWNNLGGVLKSAPATADPITATITAYVVGGDTGIWSNTITPSATITTDGLVSGSWSSSSIGSLP